MYHKLLTPLRLTIAATIGSVLVSLAVTWAVLNVAVDGAPPPVAYFLAAGIPAVFAPMVVFPLGLLLARLDRVSRELASLAHTDTLTGLPNRRAFFEEAETILSAADGARPVAALMIDVDRFKAINDDFGHAGGDVLLTAIGGAIAGAVASSGAARSVVARLGGEEFAVVVSGLVPTAVARLADHICTAGRRTRVTFGEVEIASTVSVGVATLTDAGTATIDPLLKLADDAMYLAKHGGRDRWAFAGRHAPPMEGRDLRPIALRRTERIPASGIPAAGSGSNPPLAAG
jgi:diguanylate cyclase (GGDEF)-like protein